MSLRSSPFTLNCWCNFFYSIFSLIFFLGQRCCLSLDFFIWKNSSIISPVFLFIDRLLVLMTLLFKLDLAICCGVGDILWNRVNNWYESWVCVCESQSWIEQSHQSFDNVPNVRQDEKLIMYRKFLFLFFFYDFDLLWSLLFCFWGWVRFGVFFCRRNDIQLMFRVYVSPKLSKTVGKIPEQWYCVHLLIFQDLGSVAVSLDFVMTLRQCLCK